MPPLNESTRLVKAAYERRLTHALAKAILRVNLTEGQVEIVESVLYGDKKRVVILAHTRYGKTWSIAVGIALRVLLAPKGDRVLVVSATSNQSQLIRRYLAEVIESSATMQAMLQMGREATPENLKRETSRTRLTFKTGNEVVFLSGEGDGDRLMGYGGNLILVDEADLIKKEVVRGRIRRMLGDDAEESVLVIQGNPWNRGGNLDDAWNDPAFHRIHIDAQQGLKEGRITEAFLAEQRRVLTSVEYRVLYESFFPDESIDGLYSYEAIQAALQRDARQGKEAWGLDVAEEGLDKTVATQVAVEGDFISWRACHTWEREHTMTTVKNVRVLIKEEDPVVIDENGLGKGVGDRLRELGYNANAFKASWGTMNERFANAWSEYAWHLRDAIEAGNVSLKGAPPELVRDLLRIKWTLTTAAKPKIKVFVEGGKSGGNSTDHYDSFLLATMNAKAEKPKPRVVKRPSLY